MPCHENSERVVSLPKAPVSSGVSIHHTTRSRGEIMMEQRLPIHVVMENSWKLDFLGQKYGDYTSKEEAVSIARKWAENAARQGHRVQVVIHSEQGPAFNLLIVEPPFAGPDLRHVPVFPREQAAA